MKSTNATPQLLHCNCTLLLLLLRPVIVAASYGTCTGNSIECLTTDKETCKSINGDGTNDYGEKIKCQWFDYTGLVVGLGVVIFVLGVLLCLVQERVSSLESKLKDAARTLPNGEGGDSAESPPLATMTTNERINLRLKAQKKKKEKEERNPV